jgi:hypothetical protein
VFENCAVPHQFCLADAAKGRELIANAGPDARLPLMVLPDGTALSDPSNAEIAAAAGALQALDERPFDPADGRGRRRRLVARTPPVRPRDDHAGRARGRRRPARLRQARGRRAAVGEGATAVQLVHRLSETPSVALAVPAS